MPESKWKRESRKFKAQTQKVSRQIALCLHVKETFQQLLQTLHQLYEKKRFQLHDARLHADRDVSAVLTALQNKR